MPRLRSLVAAGSAALVVVLAGCSSSADKFAPACPRVVILADAGDLTRFNGRGQDVTDMVLDGRITGVTGDCQRGDAGILVTTIAVALEIARGPAAQGSTTDFAYFVAVSRGGTILDKRVYNEHAEFPSNVNRLKLTGDQIELKMPITKEISGAAYNILVGFQLAPEELALNRKRGPR
jgi:hypothetical protein